MDKSLGRWGGTVVTGLIAAALVLIPFADLYHNLFSWHFHKPPFVQGGIELLGVATALFLLGFMRWPRWKSILLLVIVELYLRRHNVDVALLIAFLYAESMVGMGWLLFRRISAYRLPTHFIAGAALFVTFSMALSLFHGARMLPLLILQGAVLGYFYATAFKETLLHRLIGSIRETYDSDHPTRLVSVSLHVLMLMLAARAGYGLNYDETWYSLRLDQVLNVNGSFIEDLRLLGNWVHQYPKFFEVLIFPLQYFESFTVSKIFGVVVLGIGLVAAHEFWRGYGLTRRQVMLASLVLLSIPLVGVDAVSAKADFFSGFVFLLGAVYLLEAKNRNATGYLLMAMAALILSLGVKLSAVAYLPIPMLIGLYIAVAQRGTWEKAERDEVGVAVLLMLAFGAVTLRTQIITGMPFVSIPDMSHAILMLFERLGLIYKEPYSPLVIYEVPKLDSFKLLIETFMQPSVVRQSFTWMSNISLPFVAMAVIWSLRSREGRYEALLVGSMFLLMLSIIGLVFNDEYIRGGDGNYYLIPTMVIVVVGAAAFRLLAMHAAAITVLSAVYVTVNLPIAFVSSQAWAAGTRGLDLDFVRMPLDKSQIQTEILANNGLQDVSQYLSKLDQKTCVAIGEGGPALYHLGCRIETIDSIYSTRPQYASGAAAFVRLLQDKRVTHLIVQDYFPENIFGRFSKYLIESKPANALKFKFYYILDIRDISHDGLLALAMKAQQISGATMRLNTNVPNVISNIGDNKTEGGVSFDGGNSKRRGIDKYYSHDEVIFMKPDTALEFRPGLREKCVGSFEAYFSNKIQPSGKPQSGGKVTVAVWGAGRMLEEKTFDIDGGAHIHGEVPIGGRIEEISLRYASAGRKVNPNTPLAIVNSRINFCE